MSLVRLYVRVMGLLGSDRRLAAVLACANVALAVAAFAEPLLMGRIIDQLTHLKSSTNAFTTLAPLIAAYGRDDFLAMMEATGVPAGPINSVSDVFADPQVIARGMAEDAALGGTVPGVRTPIRFSDADLALSRPSPRLGQHTQEILAEIGLGAASRSGA